MLIVLMIGVIIAVAFVVRTYRSVVVGFDFSINGTHVFRDGTHASRDCVNLHDLDQFRERLSRAFRRRRALVLWSEAKGGHIGLHQEETGVRVGIDVPRSLADSIEKHLEASCHMYNKKLLRHGPDHESVYITLCETFQVEQVEDFCRDYFSLLSADVSCVSCAEVRL